MKQKVILSSIFFLAIAFAANMFAGTTKTKAVAKSSTKSAPAASKTSTIDVSKSYVSWLSKKVVGQHNGKVKLQSGSVTTKDGGVLTGGEFTIDMKTITCEDLTDQDYNKKLIGHLNSSDFFDVNDHPTATLKVTKVLKLTNKANSYNLTGDLTIKGITKSITFPATFKGVGKTFEGAATITIDRTAFDIKYGSSNFFEGLGDKAIKNDVELKVYIVAN